jgi:hypothetical protein
VLGHEPPVQYTDVQAHAFTLNKLAIPYPKCKYCLNRLNQQSPINSIFPYQQNPLYTRNTVPAAKKLLNLSITPPCPGSSALKSFILHSRLYREESKSPKIPAQESSTPQPRAWSRSNPANDRNTMAVTMAKTAPPNAPSIVLLGLMLAPRLCLPISWPVSWL